MDYKEIAKLKSVVAFRTLGGEDLNERLGIGFISKAGRTSADEVGYQPPYALIYVIRGVGRFVDSSGNEYPLRPGSIFQRHPNTEYNTYIDPDSDWFECYIDLGPNIYQLLKKVHVIRDEFVFSLVPDHWVEETCYKLMQELNSCAQHELPEQFSKVTAFLVELARRSQHQKDDKVEVMIRKSCEYLRENCMVNLDIKNYCKLNGWGYDSFRKHFRQRVGMAPGKFQIRARLEQASQMLRSTDKSVEEIADELGYSSPFAFSTQLKKHTGLSPKNYRMWL